MIHITMPACAPIAVIMPTNADTKGIAMEIFDAKFAFMRLTMSAATPGH